MMAAFRIETDWVDAEPDVRPELDHTYGQLGISADNVWLSAFESENGARGERLEAPAYPLAEWLAENWWSLLFEPEKHPGSKKDAGFRSRHWMGSAREGFALPDLWISSAGRGIVSVDCKSTFFPHARLALLNHFIGKFRADDFAINLATFIARVVGRLDAKGHQSSLLQDIWSAYTKMDADEKKYCTLLGALGFSPYLPAPGLEDVLTNVLANASEQVTVDFCEAADAGTVFDVVNDMLRSLSDLAAEPEIDLGSLFQIRQRAAQQPWQVGLHAVRAARERFNIDDHDPKGGERFFEALGIDRVVGSPQLVNDADEPVVHGALRRSRTNIQVNLIRQGTKARRFDAARSCFLAWSQAEDGERLITRAFVRDQQASRAFAAELLAPSRYIQSRVRNNTLSTYGADDIASELGVSTAVVMWQAKNNKIDVVGHSARSF